MKTYTITYDDGKRKESGEVPCCERLPKSGDVYRFTRTAYTPVGQYEVGDQLIVLERTGATPHHRVSSLGNLLIKCKYQVSVWTNIEWSIARGTLELTK